MLEQLVTGFTIVIAFLTTLVLLPRFIRKARSIGLVGKDMNKYNKPKVAEAGGISFIFGFLFAILFYIFLETFYFSRGGGNLSLVFVIATTVLLAGFLGFIDDILGWKKGVRRLNKVLLTIPIGIPLMVVNAGHSVLYIPFMGNVNFGLLYPLVLVPIGIIGAANGFNMLAGYNGLEAGLGAIILATLGIVNLYTGTTWLALVSFMAVAALLAFLIFNWCPARVFPGDSLTYSVGALIAVVAILGNMERIGLILFIPFIIDAIISLLPEVRGIGKVEAFGKINKDNSIEPPYKGIYDTTHFAIKALKRVKNKVYERDVTLFIYGLELVFVVIVFGFFI